jgi:protein tyrosine/serine phosphatase
VTNDSRPRILAWEACLNARDLGGYPAADGQETAWGAVVRADSLARLTAPGIDALTNYGVRTVIDLRLPAELADAPNPFASRERRGMRLRHISLFDPTAPPPPAYETLADDYKGVLTRFPARFAAVFDAIAAAGTGGIAIHCAGGRDRTGLVSALLLAIAGVPRNVIATDYALSTELLRESDLRWIESDPARRTERERRVAWALPRVEVMTELLDHLHRRYGGAEAYLLACGVSPADIERVRTRILGDT